MTLDCQAAAAADRRLAERAIHTTSPVTASTASRTHSQMRLVPDPPLATGEPPESSGDEALCVGGTVVVIVVVGPGEVLSTGLGVLVSGLGVLVSGLGVLVLGLGVLVLGLGEGLALGLEEMLVLRLGAKLAIALWTPLPHAAVRHPIPIAARRQRPWV
jgi:hypothetical protein